MKHSNYKMNKQNIINAEKIQVWDFIADKVELWTEKVNLMIQNYTMIKKFIMAELKDWLNSVNFTKENLIEDDPVIKDYPPYIVNRCLSGHLDTVMFANEMNKFPNLDKDFNIIFF